MSAIVVTVGLHFGDEGKGTIVDYLSRVYHPATVVRYSGGPQAAHNVVTPGGLHHVFAQFGSGSLAGAKTVLWKNMVVDPISFLNEKEVLKDKVAIPEVVVDMDCIVVTPYHKFLGRMERQSCGESTCGMGVGCAIGRSSFGITVRDLFCPVSLKEKLRHIKSVLFMDAGRLCHAKHVDADLYTKIMGCDVDEVEGLFLEFMQHVRVMHSYHIENMLLKRLDKGENIIFEGSQGILLDPAHGFSPHVTKANISTEHVKSLLSKPGFEKHEVQTLGIIRPYAHRHGTGPLPTEGHYFREEHNKFNKWQGTFRTGCFDMVLAKYALGCNPVDALAVTNIDKVDEDNIDICYEYICNERDLLNPPGVVSGRRLDSGHLVVSDIWMPNSKELSKCKPRPSMVHKGTLNDISLDLRVPISIKSYGPTFLDKVV